MARILLIDNDLVFGQFLQEELSAKEHEVHYLNGAEEGLQALANGLRFDVVLLDNHMPRMTGLEFLSELRERNLSPPVILMTEFPTDQTAIEAISLGAVSYVIKPLNFDEILEVLPREIHDATSVRRPVRPVLRQRSANGAVGEEPRMVGNSKPMLDLFKRIGKLACLDEPVLILGETGTGKELVARALHTYSPRKSKPFVARNCAGFNEKLLDAELFGNEIAAFTGATKLRKGLFEYAHGGTVFLDEVGDMPPELQVKLLRVLENGEITRVGGNEIIKVDVRVLSATHQDLKTAVREGRFRRDLYFRLEGMIIQVPPLRTRKEDIEQLKDYFLDRIFRRETVPSVHPMALEKLISHQWPGNIRELQKVLSRAVANCNGEQILPEDIDFGELENEEVDRKELTEEQAHAGLRAAIAWAWDSGQDKLWDMLKQRLEREVLRFAIEQGHFSQVQLALRLDISRNTLRDRLVDYGLSWPNQDEE